MRTVRPDSGFACKALSNASVSAKVTASPGNTEKLLSDENRLNVGIAPQTFDDAAMLGLAVGPQLAHVAQNKSFVGKFGRKEIVEGYRHARRIGIVSIDYKGVACRLYHLRTPVLRARKRQAPPLSRQARHRNRLPRPLRPGYWAGCSCL